MSRLGKSTNKKGMLRLVRDGVSLGLSKERKRASRLANAFAVADTDFNGVDPSAGRRSGCASPPGLSGLPPRSVVAVVVVVTLWLSVGPPRQKYVVDGKRLSREVVHPLNHEGSMFR